MTGNLEGIWEGDSSVVNGERDSFDTHRFKAEGGLFCDSHRAASYFAPRRSLWYR